MKKTEQSEVKVKILIIMQHANVLRHFSGQHAAREEEIVGKLFSFRRKVQEKEREERRKEV